MKSRQSASVKCVAAEIAMAREMRLELVEGREHAARRLLVAVLRSGEARAVDAVVDRAGRSARSSGRSRRAARSGYMSGSSRVANASNSRFNMRMISEDSLLTIVRRLPVPQRGHRDAARVVRPRLGCTPRAGNAAPSCRSDPRPAARVKVQPSGSVIGSAAESVIACSRPFSARKMIVRCAHGHA